MNGKRPGKPLPVKGGPRMTYARRFTAERAAGKLGIKFPDVRLDDDKRFYIAQLEPDYVDPQHEIPFTSPRGRPRLDP